MKEEAADLVLRKLYRGTVHVHVAAECNHGGRPTVTRKPGTRRGVGGQVHAVHAMERRAGRERLERACDAMGDAAHMSPSPVVDGMHGWGQGGTCKPPALPDREQSRTSTLVFFDACVKQFDKGRCCASVSLGLSIVVS